MVGFREIWICLGRSRRTEFSQTSKQNPSHPRDEHFECTSIFHEKTLCLCVFQFQTSETLDKLSKSSCTPVQIHLAWISTTLEKRQLVMWILDKTFIKIVRKIRISKKSSDMIRIEMNCLMFILSTFEICPLDWLDPMYIYLYIYIYINVQISFPAPENFLSKNVLEIFFPTLMFFN